MEEQQIEQVVVVHMILAAASPPIAAVVDNIVLPSTVAAVEATCNNIQVVAVVDKADDGIQADRNRQGTDSCWFEEVAADKLLAAAVDKDTDNLAVAVTHIAVDSSSDLSLGPAWQPSHRHRSLYRKIRLRLRHHSNRLEDWVECNLTHHRYPIHLARS